MVSHFEPTGKENKDINLSQNQAVIYISPIADARYKAAVLHTDQNVHWSKYQIKETDMRVKTASFTSPQKIDLTTGQYGVIFSSPHHENFAGLILNEEYDKKTGLYTYSCQDWSRKYLSKITFIANGQKLGHVLRFLITNGGVSLTSPSNAQIEANKTILSGMRGLDKYKESDWKWYTSINPMSTSLHILVKNKRIIDIIRDLVFSQARNIDVYFNQNGIIQIEPYNRHDFESNVLELDYRQISDVKFKFDTTNIVTGANVVNSDERGDAGLFYGNDLLRTFFGDTFVTVENIIEKKDDSSSGGTKSTSSSNTSNPYGNKARKIWINSDNGSCSFKNSVADILRSKGWEVHNGGCCSNCHYSDYFNVSSDYQVYATLYNGFCAGTIREAYSDKIQNVLKNKGVVLVVMWDTSDWTNPQGMKPYRYGDFTGYNAGRAWDDNFSSSDPSINNVAGWLKSKNAKYCASPTADGIVEQFLAGGYFAYAGK